MTYGVLNIFTYSTGQNNLIGTFLSSIPMWLVIPYIAITNSDSRQKAMLNSMMSLSGIFAGYHIASVLKSGTYSLNGYDVFWIITGAVFGLIWGIAVYPINKKGIKVIQKNILPAVFIAEALHEMHNQFVFTFYGNFSMNHILLIVTGALLFIIINRKELKNLMNYITLAIVSLAGYIGITVIYRLLYAVL